MGWAALFRRPPILRGVSAPHIRADHAVNQARINARYGPALPSSPQLRGEADAARHSESDIYRPQWNVSRMGWTGRAPAPDSTQSGWGACQEKDRRHASHVQRSRSDYYRNRYGQEHTAHDW